MFTILVLIFIFAAFYKIFLQPLTYWKNLGIPQDNLFQILTDTIVLNFIKPKGLAEQFLKFCKSFPDSRYFGIYSFFGKALVVQDPTLIKQITVKDFDHFVDHIQFAPSNETLWSKNLFSLKGEQWKSMRMILSPSFTSSKMKLMFGLILESTEKFISYFENEKRVTIEMKDVFTRFANDVIASIAFGYSCDSLRDRHNEFYTKAKEIVPKEDFIQNIKTTVLFRFPKVASFFGWTFLSKTATNFFSNVIKSNIKEREEKGIVRPDMIHLLMEEQKNRAKGGKKEVLDDVDITAQALLFFFAGYETVSTLMCFTAYELAVNVDVQNRLQAEIDDTLRECGGTISYDALFKMQYLDMVISEALRKWPPGVVTDRVCTKPYKIEPERPGEVTVYLKENDLIWLPMFGIHLDPKLFPNPERFDPDRFSEENKPNIDSYAYIPFGAGPRACIATRFALMETKLLFFQILQKFDIVVVEKTSIPLKLACSSFELTAEKGFWLGFKARN